MTLWAKGQPKITEILNRLQVLLLRLTRLRLKQQVERLKALLQAKTNG